MGLTIRYFRTPEDLGRLVQQDWSIVIDTLYPPLQDMGAALGFGKNHIVQLNQYLIIFLHVFLRILHNWASGFCCF